MLFHVVLSCKTCSRYKVKMLDVPYDPSTGEFSPSKFYVGCEDCKEKIEVELLIWGVAVFSQGNLNVFFDER